MLTSEIIKKCFKKAGIESIPDDKAKYLFQLLTDSVNVTHKEKWKIIDNEFVDILGNLVITGRNTGNTLEFDMDGYYTITDPYGKRLKKYATLEKAIDWILLND